MVTCKAIIRQVDLGVNESDIVTFSEVNIQGCSISEVRRMKVINEENASYVPTSTVCVTFSGTRLHREISIYGLLFPVLLYLLLVMQYYKCFCFEYTKCLCRGKERCGNCVQIPHHGSSCVM